MLYQEALDCLQGYTVVYDDDEFGCLKHVQDVKAVLVRTIREHAPRAWTVDPALKPFLKTFRHGQFLPPAETANVIAHIVAVSYSSCSMPMRYMLCPRTQPVRRRSDRRAQPRSFREPLDHRIACAHPDGQAIPPSR